MNSNLAYFYVSHNIEILHLNDSNEFENEINKQLEKIKLGNDENSRLIKIGSTLNKIKIKNKMISKTYL